MAIDSVPDLPHAAQGGLTERRLRVISIGVLLALFMQSR